MISESTTTPARQIRSKPTLPLAAQSVESPLALAMTTCQESCQVGWLGIGRWMKEQGQPLQISAETITQALSHQEILHLRGQVGSLGQDWILTVQTIMFSVKAHLIYRD